MTTDSVVFSVADVELLYTMPPGTDLTGIVRTFTFVNRSAPPPLSVLRDCFTKALQAGILIQDGGRFRIVPEWYERIHAHDESEANEIQSMLAFQDEFVGEVVPVVAVVQFDLTERDYEDVLQKLREEGFIL